MTAVLIVLLPAALLVLVSGFCFVGCVLDTSGLPPDPKPEVPFTKYSESITGTMSCIAYWPLDEAAPANDSAKITAHDAKGSNDGEYKHKGNAASFFPCPQYQVSAGVDSAQAIGFLSLGTQSLLPGDAKQPANDPTILTTGMQTDGAFVSVPFNAGLNLAVFSVEAWARPEWDAASAAYRVVVDSRNSDGTLASGFAIWVNEAGLWEAQLCLADGTFLFIPASKAALSAVAHLVLTFGGGTAKLYVDGVATTAMVPGGTAYAPNMAQKLVIGAGLPWLPDRMQPTDNFFFPLLPFHGTIQSVAIYNNVLSDTEVKKHFDDGSGKTTVPAG